MRRMLMATASILAALAGALAYSRFSVTPDLPSDPAAFTLGPKVSYVLNDLDRQRQQLHAQAANGEIAEAELRREVARREVTAYAVRHWAFREGRDALPRFAVVRLGSPEEADMFEGAPPAYDSLAFGAIVRARGARWQFVTLRESDGFRFAVFQLVGADG